MVNQLFEIPSAAVAALAALTLSLGATYWLMRHRDERMQSAEESGSPPPVQKKPA